MVHYNYPYDPATYSFPEPYESIQRRTVLIFQDKL